MLSHIKTRAQMAEALRICEQAGDTWHAPLIRAAMVGDIRFTILPPGTRLPLAMLDMPRQLRPLLVLAGGDAGGLATPHAFPQSRRLMRWAGFTILHGAGGEAWHYTMAAEVALHARRVLIVETSGAALPAWIALKAEVVPGTPGLVFKVPPGRPAHPCEAPPPGARVQ